MVKPTTPSTSTKRNIRRRQRNKNTDILVVIAVTIISVSLAWLFALRLINRQKVNEHNSFAAPHLLNEDNSNNEDTTITTDNMNMISAKHMLATRSNFRALRPPNFLVASKIPSQTSAGMRVRRRPVV